jgi:hypothetical protein
MRVCNCVCTVCRSCLRLTSGRALVPYRNYSTPRTCGGGSSINSDTAAPTREICSREPSSVHGADSADHPSSSLPGQGRRSWASHSDRSNPLRAPPFPSPPAGRLLHPCARRWSSECLSKNEQRRRVFRLAARLLRGGSARCFDSSTRRARSRTHADNRASAAPFPHTALILRHPSSLPRTAPLNRNSE